MMSEPVGHSLLSQTRREAEGAEAMTCMKCGKPEAHFVGPSLGESGFYICDVPTKDAMTLTKWNFDDTGLLRSTNRFYSEEYDGNGFYLAADVEAREREIIEVLRICTDGFGRPDGPSINNRKRVYSLLAQMEWRP